LSYANVQNNPKRCARIVNAEELETDIKQGSLATYSLYIPDNKNNGHDTSVKFASQWLERAFGERLRNSQFMKGTLFVVTFDEDDGFFNDNKVYTTFYGDSVVTGAVSHERYDHYSLLRTIEDALGLGSLGNRDSAASRIRGIWRQE
jgi:hypothetical protein